MGTDALPCPLCCNESFSSRESLKEHIIDILNNLVCETCDTRFESVYNFVDHLETPCETSIKHEILSQENGSVQENGESNEQEEECTVTAVLEERLENQKKVQPEEEKVTYMCVMCNIQFSSIEDHLDKFHAGEEVLLETEDGDNEQQVSVESDLGNNSKEEEDEEEEETFEISNEPIDNDQLDQAEEEQQLLEHEQTLYESNSNKSKKPIPFLTPPITENYAIQEFGVVKKITEEEAAEIVDRSSIVQIHQCPKCYLQFPKIEHYVKHTCNITKNSVKRNKCVHCSASFQNHQSLVAHLKTHVKTSKDSPNKIITLGPHTCDVCNTMFPSFKSLRLHKRMHEPLKNKPIESPVSAQPDAQARQMFVCHICNNTYDIEYEEVHMKSHTDEDNFYCATCNRKFLTKENLEMHTKAHTNTKKFVCSYCKKPFTTHNSLNVHVNNHCHKRSYECQYCGRRFSRPCEKVKHERIHTGEKPHVCQICGKAFRVSYCLTLHMRTHSGSRPYECSHCGKRFKSHSVYNHHLLIHSDVRAYKCPYCPKAFKTSVQLAGHKNSHVKPFSCTKCNRPFASLYAVRAHMETHERENNLKFDCWLCGATYARAFALKDHMNSQHAGEQENVNENEEESMGAEGEVVDEENNYRSEDDDDEQGMGEDEDDENKLDEGMMQVEEVA
ncbi:unnamed protein product [Phyllotreta striolata]|uniref:C2H2-type domain-containing protein n=1 Tax=Phyllotreta striolata TaxID=444603 RepID=A0A9N9XSD4_PHYSR|nr:unnamed protein product [Phyllotreta striolata]